ncbi:MAG: DUF4421 family protein [Bacteroidales bacterium]|nr:DUF4421 family protein [Bacteroidales bacterium]MBR4274002.1 DUF4421 family protein [Bacteroidales bacterium]
MNNTLRLATLIALVLTFCTLYGTAQNANYVKKYGHLLSVKSFLYNDEFTFRNKSTGLNYIPALHSGVGVGVWCKYFPFDVCYRQEVSPIGPDKNYNNVKSTDMQLRGYNRFFAGDIYIQRYSGFYESIEDRFHIKSREIGELPYNPDIKVSQFDMVGKYIFNNEEFSYKAGFTAGERQLISQGSATVGAALYYLRIRSDSLLLKEQSCDLRSCNIGVNGGYAYNYVFGKHSTLFASGMIGLNASTSIFKGWVSDKIHLSPVFHFKGAYWLNYDKWSFGITTTYNIIHHSLGDEMTVYVHTRRTEVVVMRRIWMKKKLPANPSAGVAGH